VAVAMPFLLLARDVSPRRPPFAMIKRNLLTADAERQRERYRGVPRGMLGLKNPSATGPNFPIRLDIRLDIRPDIDRSLTTRGAIRMKKFQATRAQDRDGRCSLKRNFRIDLYIAIGGQRAISV